MDSKNFTLKGVGEGLVYGGLVGLACLADCAVHYPPGQYYAQIKNNPHVKTAENLEQGVSEDLTLKIDTVEEVVQETVEIIPDPVDTVAGVHLNVIRSNSPNYRDVDRTAVDTIVLHTTEGTGSSALNTFQNPANQVSAHYLVMETGDIYSVVSEEDIAWHCRGHNDTSIGIEIAGHHDRDLNPEQIESVQGLIKDIQSRYGLDNSNIRAHSELDPSRRRDPGEANFRRILDGI